MRIESSFLFFDSGDPPSTCEIFLSQQVTLHPALVVVDRYPNLRQAAVAPLEGHPAAPAAAQPAVVTSPADGVLLPTATSQSTYVDSGIVYGLDHPPGDRGSTTLFEIPAVVTSDGVLLPELPTATTSQSTSVGAGDRGAVPPEDRGPAAFEITLDRVEGLELADDVALGVVIARMTTPPDAPGMRGLMQPRAGDAVKTLNGYPRPSHMHAAEFTAVLVRQPLPIRIGLERPGTVPAAWRSTDRDRVASVSTSTQVAPPPAGWQTVPRRSRPGEISYLNPATNETIPARPHTAALTTHSEPPPIPRQRPPPPPSPPPAILGSPSLL